MATPLVQIKVGEEQIKLLAELSNAAGVSGAEGAVRTIILDKLKEIGIEVREDALGNVIAHRPAKIGNAKKVMISAHMDEVGLMITVDEEEGLYAFAPVGEVDVRQLPGKTVIIGKNNTPGVIGARAIHLTTVDQRKQAIPLSTLRIDVGPKNKVTPGERAVFGTEFWQNGNSLFGKALDNRLGIVSMIEILKTASDSLDLYCIFSAQKEIGNRGEMTAAYDINPDFVIILDAAIAEDFPGDKPGQGTTGYGSRLGAGAVIYPMHRRVISDPALFEYFIMTAEKEKIQYQIGQANNIETRAESLGAINKIRAGMRSINISVPVRYPHTAISLAYISDWQSTISLLTAGLEGLNNL